MKYLGLGASDWWIIATAVFCSVACGLLGCFLVLRRRSLLGDAISHAILPGLAIAFMVTNSRAVIPMLLGATVVGVLTVVFSEALNRWGKVPEDAAMGVVFTSLFALGVLLITRVAPQVDLDPGCVLYGLIEFVPLDTVTIAGYEIPRATLILGGILAVNITLIVVFFKELQIVSFDPYLATTMGINATLVHYGLMAAVAATTVAAFESVGSILVVAMLIAPGATAYLLTDNLRVMLIVSAVIAAIAGAGGYLLAQHERINSSVAGMMSVVAGAEFLLAALCAPRHGYLSKLLHQAALSLRVVREDILGLLYRWQEVRRPNPLRREDILAALGDGLLPRIALVSLRYGGRIRRGAQGLTLSEAGRVEAKALVRSHRLWESFLAKRLGLPLDHLHAPAMRMEHFVTPKMGDQLAQEVQTDRDPQGRTIPPP